MRPDVDGHVHLENGPLTKEYVWEFVNAAKEKGLKHLQILDHTHRFYEFKDMYADVEAADPRQKAWFAHKQVNSIKDYQALIEECRKEDFPIDVTFGLEVCWNNWRKDFLSEILPTLGMDFLVGSVHSMDGKLYDMDGWSREILWDKEDVSSIYKRYWDQLAGAIESDLFTQIGHPDVIKMYNYDPGYDQTDTYKMIARLAKTHNVKLEDNTGAHYRYHHQDVGLDNAFRDIIKKEGAQIITASDGHWPRHVAMDFELLPEVE